MLNFDEDRYVRIQSGAVGLAEKLDEQIKAALDEGAENLFFVATGGVLFLMEPAAQLLRTTSTFPVFVENGPELVAIGNAHLNEKSIVVIPSVSGTTKESVQALDLANERGARTITLTGHADTPLAERAAVNFTNTVADDTSSENYYLQSLLVALSVMKYRGELEDYDQVVSELKALPELLVEVKRGFEDRAKAFAEEIKDEQHHIMTGGGTAWYEAWYYGMCILEEMQWIWTRPVHPADFFHGTLELMEEDTSLILLKGEDAGRVMADRVERFAKTITTKLRVFDSKDFELPGISDRVRALISPLLFSATFERISAHLEVLREHPLTTRRYYKKGDF